jgi:hypothetical protein
VLLGGHAQRIGAGVRLQRTESVPFKTTTHDVAIGLVIVDSEDGAAIRHNVFWERA